MLGRIAATVFLVSLALGIASFSLSRNIRASGGARVQAITVESRGRVSARTIMKVLLMLRHVVPAVDSDFQVPVRHFMVRFYASHAAFSRQLQRTEHVTPEGAGDNTGNIVEGVLPLGPDSGGDLHRLAHVYTEWILDRLVHNSTDQQPRPAWLYDGLAEYEADRVGGHATCVRTQADDLLPLSKLVSPRDWWRIRGTPFGPLEYCEAETHVQRLLKGVPWHTVLSRLKNSGSWTRFAQRAGA